MTRGKLGSIQADVVAKVEAWNGSVYPKTSPSHLHKKPQQPAIPSILNPLLVASKPPTNMKTTFLAILALVFIVQVVVGHPVRVAEMKVRDCWPGLQRRLLTWLVFVAR